MDAKPICYDLYSGLHGWLEAFLAEGYTCVAYDIVDMCAEIGQPRPEGIELRIRDVRSIHGSELKNATCIVGSSPCQEFSYRAMPWKRAKALPPPYLGMELFNAQFRIQREASEAAGHHISMVVENVRGAQKWVGRAQWHYGSFYLWGDVPALMPMTLGAQKVIGYSDPRRNGGKGAHCTSQRENDGRKVPGIKLSEVGFNVAAAQRYREGVKARVDGQGGHGGNFGWDGSPMRRGNSHPDSRKAASAMIAKIPFPLAQHIARAFNPIPLDSTSR